MALEPLHDFCQGYDSHPAPVDDEVLREWESSWEWFSPAPVEWTPVPPSETVAVQKADLEKMLDVVERAFDRCFGNDEANAALHLAPVRMSPLTSALESVAERIRLLLEGKAR